MISYALDANNNMFIGKDGLIATATDGAETVQAVRCRLQFFLGEASWATQEGVPYFERILGKHRSPDEIESILKAEILNTNGVKQLLSFALTIDNETRLATATWEAETTYGEIIGSTLNDIRIN